MKKTIILLACSRKISNYCVAGIDRDSGDWVRIISEDDSIQHAVRATNMIYEDGSQPQLFDIIQIPCKRHSPNYYQPENWIFDKQYYWEKVGRTDMKSILKIHPVETPMNIFYDDCWKIESEYISQLNTKYRYSLTLIRPTDLYICVGPKRNNPNKKSITAQFIYNSHLYRYITVTDIDYENRYSQYADGMYKVDKNVLLVLSLADIYQGCHYKLVATVIHI